MMDNEFISRIENNINMIVPLYLVAAYAYYIKDDPLISDAVYDLMATTFLEYYDVIEHRHKHLVDKDALAAGTCLIKEYPLIVDGAYTSLCESLK